MKKNIDKYEGLSEYVNEYMQYDALTGVISWGKRPPHSRTKIGNEAGAVQNGYRFVTVKHKRLYSSHIAWFLSYGYWPEFEIDHRNNNSLDNRLDNLREATRAQNARNVRSRSATGKGLKGAYWFKEDRRWFAQIRFRGKQIYLGRFDTEEEAHDAYVTEAKRLHGEFARAA